MSTAKRLVGSGSIYIGATAAQAIAGFAVLPVVTHVLEPDVFGQVAILMVVAQLTTVLTAAGFPVPILREHSAGEGRSRGLATVGVVTAGSIGAALAVVGWMVTSFGIGETLSTSSLLIAVAVGTLQGATDCTQALLRAEERALAWALPALVRSVGGPIAGATAAAIRGGSSTDYLLGLLVAAALSLLFSVALSRPGLPPSSALVRGAVSIALPTIVHGAGMYLVATSDRAIVGAVLGTEEAGRYQLAYVLGGSVILLVQSIANAWAALVLGAEPEDRDKTLAESIRLVVPVVAAGAVVVAAVGPWALPLLAPADFRPDTLGPVVSVVATAAIPYVLYSGAVLVPMGRGRTIPLLALAPATAACNIAGNLLVVEPFGLVGAALVTLGSYALLAALVRLLATRHGVRRWPPGVDSAAAVGVVVCLATGVLPGGPAFGVVRATVAVSAVVAARRAVKRTMTAPGWDAASDAPQHSTKEVPGGVKKTAQSGR